MSACCRPHRVDPLPHVALTGVGRVGRGLAAALLTLAAVVPRPASADDARADRVRELQAREWSLTAARLEGALRLDGRVDEPAWDRAVPASEFYQGENNEGLPASERTEIRVLYDDTHLYIGIRCFDSDPAGVRALSLFRDENSSDDLILVAIDAFRDRRSSVHFVTNANGYMVDSLQTGETTATRNQNWNTVWDARGTRTPEGWDAELAIPFKSLRFNRPAPGEPLVFGIGFKRNLPRKNEEANWPFVANDSSWYRPSELGRLHGLDGVVPGRNLELRPYAVGGVAREAPAAPARGRRDAGLDAKWGVTPGLTADFTLNTDFAQEEADVLQTNFTRFSLFFPEKRQFFLEGQQMFQFGLAREADLIFTRRIGLSNDGRVIPIRGGARLSGRQGRTSLGLMSLQTDATDATPGENFSVVRVRRDVFSRSSVGAVVTNRQGGEGFNRVAGVDASLRFRRVWVAEGFVAALHAHDAPGVQHAAYARAAYDADRLGVSYQLVDVDRAFRPGVGFVSRLDRRDHAGEVRVSRRPRASWLRQVHATASGRYVTNQAGTLETRERGLAVSGAFETGDTLALDFVDRLEAIEQPFPLRPGVTIAPGTYRFGTWRAQLNTFRRRRGRVNLTAASGAFWGGSRDTFVADGYYRFTKHFGTSLRYEVNRIDLPDSRFVSQLASSRIEIAFTKDMVLLPLLQYNPDLRQLSSNVRFHWIVRPGTDVFVVYTELDELRRPAIVRNRSLVAKMNYLLAF